MNEARSRQLLGFAIPVAALLLVVVPYLLVREDLPDRLATHFDGSGVPNGSMTPVGLLFFTVAFAGSGVAVCAWLARTQKLLPASLAPILGFLGGFFAGLGGGIAAVTFVSQQGLESWVDAGDISILVAAPLGMALALGALAARAAAKIPAAPTIHRHGSQPTMELAAGEHAVWAETLHSALLFRLGAGAMIVGVVVAIGAFWWLLIPSIITGVAALSLATLQVRADGKGLHVKYGMLPWPRTNVEVADMETASVIDVRPMEWGGWGYRGSLKLMRQAAVVHRAGPGIRLDLSNGKVFVVTVDNPETPVALLNAEIARSH